jgi:hypothetical protein
LSKKRFGNLQSTDSRHTILSIMQPKENGSTNLGGLRRKKMIQARINLWKTALRRRVYATLLAAILPLIIAMPLIAPAAETQSAPMHALMPSEPWIGGFYTGSAR